MKCMDHIRKKIYYEINNFKSEDEIKRINKVIERNPAIVSSYNLLKQILKLDRMDLYYSNMNLFLNEVKRIPISLAQDLSKDFLELIWDELNEDVKEYLGLFKNTKIIMNFKIVKGLRDSNISFAFNKNLMKVINGTTGKETLFSYVKRETKCSDNIVKFMLRTATIKNYFHFGYLLWMMNYSKLFNNKDYFLNFIKMIQPIEINDFLILEKREHENRFFYAQMMFNNFNDSEKIEICKNLSFSSFEEIMSNILINWSKNPVLSNDVIVWHKITCLKRINELLDNIKSYNALNPISRKLDYINYRTSMSYVYKTPDDIYEIFRWGQLLNNCLVTNNQINTYIGNMNKDLVGIFDFNNNLIMVAEISQGKINHIEKKYKEEISLKERSEIEEFFKNNNVLEYLNLNKKEISETNLFIIIGSCFMFIVSFFIFKLFGG